MNETASTAVKRKKFKSQLFFSLLILSNVFGVSSADACDKSRKVLEGNFGEITHLTGNGQNSNYTQVGIKINKNLIIINNTC